VRDNGLTAAAYDAVADLVPGQADAALARLADEGVAAYASPAPARPGVDRLYVDAAATDRARDVLAALLAPASDGRLDIDAAFADIVAGFADTAAGDPADSPVARWPAPEDLETSTDPGAGSPPMPSRVVRSAPGWDVPEPAPEPPPPTVDAEERFVPPPPPPLPETDASTRFAWAAVVTGPVLLVAAALTGWQPPDWLLGLAAVGFVGGFVALVARLKDRPDDDPDGGAVV
jgi:general stress protein CsbA